MIMKNLQAGMNKANSSLAIKEITIFLVTSNEETTSNAYKSLLAQDCNFKIVEIKNMFKILILLDVFPRFTELRRIP